MPYDEQGNYYDDYGTGGASAPATRGGGGGGGTPSGQQGGERTGTFSGAHEGGQTTGVTGTAYVGFGPIHGGVNRQRRLGYQQREEDTWQMGEGDYAAAQVRQGIEAQQRAMYGDAAVGGPAAQRGAMYAGGELEARGQLLQEQARQAQALQDQQTRLGMIGRRPSYEIAEHGMLTDWDTAQQAFLTAEQQRAMRQRAGQEAGAAANDAAIWQGVGTGASVLGTWLGGAASDERLKSGLAPATAREQDMAIDELGTIGGQLAESDRNVNRQLEANRPLVLGRREADELNRLKADREAQDIYRELTAGNAASEREMGFGPVGGMAGGTADRNQYRADASSLDSDRRAMAIAKQLQAEQDRVTRELEGLRYEYSPYAQEALGQPKGDMYGISAQRLERAPLGRGMVQETPHGKYLDPRAALGTSLGLIGRLGERVDDLERRRR